jgi:hypothetical protein
VIGDGISFSAWHMAPEPPVKLGSFDVGEGETEKTVLKQAKAECERHAAGDQEAPAATATDKPQRELGSWSIPVPLTAEEKDKVSKRLGEIHLEVRGKQHEIDDAKERFAKRRKGLEADIEALWAEADEAADKASTGHEYRYVRCHREADEAAGEIVYSDEAGNELYRDVLQPGQQLSPWGGAPPDKPPATEPLPEPDDDEPDPDSSRDGPPWDEDERPDPLPADSGLHWRPLNVETEEGEQRHYVAGDVEGDTMGEHYRLAKAEGSKLWEVSYTSPDGDKRQLAGCHKLLRDARAMAEADNQARLRWPPNDGRAVMLDGTAKYQLTCHGSGEGTVWSGQVFAGGVDEGAEDLGEHRELSAAQAACQTHADERRATDGEAGQ